tara:strand:- start:1162 stop:1413 length:252 start_codon:yes stop_codon:yes gene_type:complete
MVQSEIIQSVKARLKKIAKDISKLESSMSKNMTEEEMAKVTQQIRTIIDYLIKIETSTLDGGKTQSDFKRESSDGLGSLFGDF